DDECPLHRRSLTGPDMCIGADQDLPIRDRQPADSRMVAFDGVVRGAMILDRQDEAVLLLDVPTTHLHRLRADSYCLCYGVCRLKLPEYGYEFFFATRRSRHRSI